MNVLVLCRACNSSKGETSYRLYLNPEQLQKAKVCQDALMESVLGDEKTLGVIRSWCGVRV